MHIIKPSERGQAVFLAVLVIGLIAVGLFAFMWDWSVNGKVSLGTRPEYADTDGDGFVPAQGDPIWDEHYAKDVNDPNSQALDNLGDAAIKEAQAEYIEVQTKKETQGMYLSYAAFAVVIVALVVVVIGVIRG